MEKIAYKYYKEGASCSGCLLKAFENYYKIPLNKQCYYMTAGINNGFGIGSTCSVLMASVMMFGILFEKETVKRLRMKLFSEFLDIYKDLGCYEIKKERKHTGNCAEVVKDIALITKRLIDEEKSKR